MYVTKTAPSLGSVLYEMVRSVVIYVYLNMYVQAAMLAWLASAAATWLRTCTSPVLDSYQCRSLVDCHPPCGICVRVAHDSSLFSSLTSSHSLLCLQESRVAHYSDTLAALCDSISGEEYWCHINMWDQGQEMSVHITILVPPPKFPVVTHMYRSTQLHCHD